MKLIIFLSFIAIAAAALPQERVDEEWNNFKVSQLLATQQILNFPFNQKSFHKHYDEAEDQERFLIFKENLQFIKEHNKLFNEREISFNLAVNQFVDMKIEEIGQEPHVIEMETDDSVPCVDMAVPDEIPGGTSFELPFDWRDKGAVTEVRDQGKCKSSWAFAAVGALESLQFIKNGKLVQLSAQQLLDCAGNAHGNEGCKGGSPPSAYKYLEANDGIDTAKSYLYSAQVEDCRFNNETIGATMKEFHEILPDEEAIRGFVQTHGPVSVGIDARWKSFLFYSSGVYHEPKCNSSVISHHALIVGLGTTFGREDYWIVKNSWGSTWGNEGYIWMARNKDNHCGIASEAIYVDVKEDNKF